MRLGPQTIVHVPRRFVAEEWGGTETVILEISRQQQQAGANPVIMTSMALARSRNECIGGIRVNRFPHLYPFFGLSREDKVILDKKGGNLLSFSLLWALLREPKVRLFHAHSLKRMGGIVLTAARFKRKPYVVSLHGGVFDVPLIELTEMRKPIRDKREWGKVFGAILRSRHVLTDADYVICVGENEMRRAKESLPHDRIAYLPNGVDFARFAVGDGDRFRQKHGLEADAFVILNLGRIDPQKNQMLLVQAFEKARREIPKAVLMLIGPETQPGYAGKLREFIATNHLDEVVKILPGIKNDSPDLVDAYHACNLFVLPSIHEPFGIVVLEAWSAGRPVVVTRVGGLNSLVREGKTGCFLDPGSAEPIEELSAKMQSLAKSPERREQLGSAGRDEARSKYGWVAIGRQLEQIYQQAEAHARARYGGTR